MNVTFDPEEEGLYSVSQALPLHFNHTPKLWSTYTLMNYMRTRAIIQSLTVEIYPLLDHHIQEINVRLDHVFHFLLLQSCGENTACMIWLNHNGTF